MNSYLTKQYKNQWLKIYKDLYNNGIESSPRNLKIKELQDYLFFGNPYNRFASFKERNLNIKYIVGEFCWYLRGKLNDLNGIEYYSSFWKKIANDKKPLLNSNYGFYINKQFDYCLNCLFNDKDTRQASIIIANLKNNLSSTKDKICTYSINFRIRENKLNMSVNMRSNDFILGTQIDYFQFSVFQEMLLKKLQIKYNNLEIGYYSHKADSLHIYENKFKIMNSIIESNGNNFELIEFPKIKDDKEVDYIFKELPKIELKIRNYKSIEKFLEFIKTNNFKFTETCIKYLKN